MSVELAAAAAGEAETATNFFDAPPGERVPSIAKSNEIGSPLAIPPPAMPQSDATVLAMAAQTKIAAAPPSAAPEPRAATPKAPQLKPVRVTQVGARDGGSIYRKKPGKPEPGEKAGEPAQPSPAPSHPAPANPPPVMDGEDGKDRIGAAPPPLVKPETQVAKITVIDTDIVGSSAARQLIGASVGSSSQSQGSLLSASVLPKDGKIDGLVVVAINGKTLLGGGEAALININAFQNGTPGGGVLPTVAAVTAPVAAVVAPVVDTAAAVVAPAVDTAAAVVVPVVATTAAVAAPVTNTATTVAAPVVSTVAPVVNTVVAPVIAPVVNVIAPALPVVGGLLGGAAPSSH